VTTGASSDLERATAIARNLVTRYGMSDLGPRTFGHKEELIFLGKELREEKNYSEKTAEDIDKQVSQFIDNAYNVAEKMLADKKDVLDKVSSVLLEKETIEQEEFNALVGIEKKEKPEDNIKPEETEVKVNMV